MHEPIDPAAAAERAGVRIRAIEPEDIGAISSIMSEPGVTSGTLQVPYTSIALRRERWAPSYSKPDVHSLGAVSLEDDGLVGNLGIHIAPQARRRHTASLGMSVATEWQGRGVGTALMAAAVDLADNWLQLRRLHLEVYTDNEPALRLYRRFGFELEGTLRQDAFRDGAYVDLFTMGRLRPSP